MIYFVTRKQHKVVNIEDELEIIDDLTLVSDYINKLSVIGFDLETTGLDPYKNDILLLILGDDKFQYVIDVNSYTFTEIYTLLSFIQLGQFLGQNLKFDYKFIKTKYKTSFKNLYDVMIVEQRILQGAELSNKLDDIVLRRLKTVPMEMNKNIRLDFVNSNKDYFTFENHHITYSAADIKYLFDIKAKQELLISKANQEFLIYDIEFPLISVLGDCELEGFKLNLEKWKDLIVQNKEKRFELQCQLDEELKYLRSILCSNENLKYLTGGKFDRTRIKKSTKIVDIYDLFGELIKESSKAKEDKDVYVNYSSTDQLVQIFARLNQPVPTKQGQDVIPTFKTNLKGKQIIDKSSYNFTTGEGVIEEYLLNYPNTPIKKFIKLLIDYREVNTRLNTFGQKFIDNYLNPVSNKVHTIFRQCDAISGRLQSGDAKNGWYNSQNIPGIKDYRECFGTDDGYSIVTTDLSGAEAVIMIDKAHDEKFYDMAIVNDDAHSPLCQAIWRKIGESRFNNIILPESNFSDVNTFNESELESIRQLSKIVISKKENKDKRTAFKPITFGSIYGARAKKIAKVMNISEQEGKLALNTIKSMIPKTFKMVERNVQIALTQGFLIINERTNSRIWYPKVHEAKKNKSSLSFMDEHTIDGSARNTPIQGTQADMVKECMVVIAKDIFRQNLDACLLGQVHDELIYKFNDKYLEPSVQYVDEDGLVSLETFSDFIKLTMCKVCNRYLSYIKMTAEGHTGKTWTK